jgi:hypothetical protein
MQPIHPFGTSLRPWLFRMQSQQISHQDLKNQPSTFHQGGLFRMWIRQTIKKLKQT